MELLSEPSCAPCTTLRTRSQVMTHSDCSDATDEKLIYASEKKRKESHMPTLRSQTKRVRHDGKVYRAVVEQLTPEASLTPQLNLRTYGPFFPGQFEDGTVLVVKMKEAELVDSIAIILTKICRENEKASIEMVPGLVGKPPYRSKKYPDGSSSVFFSLSKPSVVLKNYITRFVRYLNVSRSVFIVSLIYLDRVRSDDNMLALTELNIHRLITTALCTAAKFLEDESHRNSSLSRIGGVPTTEEMNVLETQFLRRLRWDCSVSADTYQLYEESVLQKSCSAMRQLT